MFKTISLGTTAALLLSASTAMAATEVEWWHAMGGSLGEKVNKIAADFNASQDMYEVKPVFKGSYAETMTSAIAAFRAGEQPHIVQVFEVGTATMMAAKGAIYPVEQLMKDTGTAFDKSDYLPAVISYYQTPEGELLSMPFNSSSPVLWYNQDALDKIGAKAPSTWAEVEEVANQMVASGRECGLTVSWQGWVLAENYSTWHNLPYGTKENGFGGFDTEFTFNNGAVANRLQRIADMQENGAFKYGGPSDGDATLFTGGNCGMWMTSSASYASIKSNSEFNFGQTMLPLDTEVADKPQNSIIGGATLWVLEGHESEEYKGVAQFMNYLSSADVQAWWHQQTGYVPITTAAYELSKEQGFYEQNPGTDTAIKQLSLNAPTPNSRGLRFGNYVQVRDIIDSEFEALWTGKKSAREALDSAVEQGDALLRKFERSVARSGS